MDGVKSISIILVVATILVATLAPHGEAAMGCGQVVTYINPCMAYLAGQSPSIGLCCSGVKGLYNAAATTSDRQSVCNCLKSIAKSYTGPIVTKAAGLPGQCGVNIPYKISPSTDCSKVQ